MDGQKRECQVVGVDEDSRVVKEARFPATIESLREFAWRLEDRDRVAVEASSSGRLIHKVLRDAGVDVHPIHGAGVALIARAKVKTDVRAAEVLAQLNREILERMRQEGRHVEIHALSYERPNQDSLRIVVRGTAIRPVGLDRRITWAMRADSGSLASPDSG